MTRHLLKVAAVANIFEWYEFIVYAYLADVIGQIFFREADTIRGLIQALTVFAIGYLARPLGSLFFGMMGDRLGRGHSLRTTLMMSAIPTVFIGLLPTYQNIGLFAPFLLLILRLVQGFAMGAELPVNGCYVFEAAPNARSKSILCSAVMASMDLGTLLASLIVFVLFKCFDHQTILAWAWRIPFLLSLPLVVGISAIRRTINDFPVLKQDRSTSTFDALRRPLLKTVLPVSFLGVFVYLCLIWMPTYLIHFLHYPVQSARLLNTLFAACLICFNLGMGYLSSFVGYHRLIKVGMIATCLFVYPLFSGLIHASFGMISIILGLLALLLASIEGVILQGLATQFPSFVRCRGMNIAYTFPITVFGGTAPLVCTWMIQKTGLLLFPAFYIMLFGLLALPAAWRLRGV